MGKGNYSEVYALRMARFGQNWTFGTGVLSQLNYIIMVENGSVHVEPLSTHRTVADPARGQGAHAPPLAAWQFFRQYINIITKSTAYDGPREY